MRAAFFIGLAMAEEVASNEDVAVSVTLLGSVLSFMTVYYMLNHYDLDVRRYSYKVLNCTISIFIAVMIFSSWNDVIQQYFGYEEMDTVTKTIFNAVHTLIWFLVLQTAVAVMAKCHKTAEDRDAIINDLHMMKEVELNMHSWAQLLAHITGFAAINFWGSLQQTDFFRQNAFTAFLVVPLALLVNLVGQRGTDFVRESYALLGDGVKDELETCWDDEVEESENDVTGLSISFLISQAIRFGICGSLSNQEGEESSAVETNHTFEQCVSLFGAGIIFIVLFATFKVHLSKEEDEHRHEMELESDDRHPIAKGVDALTGGERFGEMIIVILNMCMAWSFFFGSRWALASSGLLGDDMVLIPLCLAVVITLLGMVMTIGLDVISNWDYTTKYTDEVIELIVEAIGILIGFAWEQIFDASVAAIASRTSNPTEMKFGLAICVSILVIPAWRRFMLPMVVHCGFRFGFIAQQATDKLDPKDKKMMKHFAMIQKHFNSYNPKTQKCEYVVKPPKEEESESESEEEESGPLPTLYSDILKEIERRKHKGHGENGNGAHSSHGDTGAHGADSSTPYVPLDDKP
jgi:hypothetical protein